MRPHLCWGILLTLFLQNALFSQQLVINEVSQGASGSKEYVELVVVGTPGCDSIPTMDLRNYIIDDNNGNHASGTGTGIAGGCVRLANIAFWSHIPIGTIILFYNSSDLNASVPASDYSMSDGNCRLVIPISDCTLLERHTSQPSTAVATYPTSGFTSCGGSWSEVSMANGDDSFQVINPSGSLAHSVSWGNNTGSTIIYFSGTAAGYVMSNLNTVDHNPATQGNWSKAGVSGNETPGSPNNPANAAWISSMNNSCMPLLPFSASVTASGVGCGCTGSAVVTTTGGIAPYTYTWLPAGPNASVATGLCSGTYTVIAASSSTCSQITNTFEIISSAGTLSASAASSNVSCAGSANGSATVIPSGGSPGYTYTWSPSGGHSSVAANLAIGIYTVTIRDAVNCTTTATVSVTPPPAGLTGSVNTVNASCGLANGSASVIASGGTLPYTYIWVPSGGGNSAAANNLAVGNYSVYLIAANGCATTVPFQIVQSTVTANISTQNVSCFGETTGGATVIASGGSSYTYLWIPSMQTSSVATGLGAGTYTVHVTNANSCSVAATATIFQPAAALSAVVSSTETTCGAANGAAKVLASGGTPGYTYMWSPGGNTSSQLTNIQPGVYTATISDVNNCRAVKTVTVDQIPIITTTLQSTDVSCNGFANGSATLVAGGPAGSYTVTWQPGNVISPVISALPPGNYSVAIVDNHSCNVANTFTITEPPLLVPAFSSGDVNCFGESTGSITAFASGGTPAYTFSWSQGGSALPVQTNLGAGTYSVQIKDSKNCSISETVTINQPAAPPSVLLSKTNISCYGMNDGSLSAQVNGGTPVYSYAWSTGSGLASITALPPGAYQLQVTDQNGCQASAIATLTQSAQPLTATASLTHVACYNDNTGSIILTTSGGDGGYTYSWSPAVSATSSAGGLAAGNYTITVADAKNCTVSVAPTLTQSPALSVIVDPLKSCGGGTSATLTAQAAGGNPPYTYSWNGPAQTTPTLAIIVTATTIYTVSAIDVLGCTSNPDTTLVQAPPPLTLAANPTTSVCAGSQATLAAIASGGDGTITYNWQPGGGNESVYEFMPAANQLYTVTVTDGCLASLSKTVAVAYYPLPVSNITFAPQRCPPACITFSNLPLQTSGIIKNYEWLFDSKETKTDTVPQYCFTTPGPHNVYLTYTTNDGCVGRQFISTIYLDALPKADFIMNKTELDSYDLSVSVTNNSQGATSYIWYFNGEGESVEKDTSFTFATDGSKWIYLIASNNSGCTDTAFKELKFRPEYTFYAPNIFTPHNGDGLNDRFLPIGTGWKTDKYELTIYDRWGELIFETTQYDTGWNGTVKHSATLAQNDVYVWKVSLYETTGKRHEYIGFVTLE